MSSFQKNRTSATESLKFKEQRLAFHPLLLTDEDKDREQKISTILFKAVSEIKNIISEHVPSSVILEATNRVIQAKEIYVNALRTKKCLDLIDQKEKMEMKMKEEASNLLVVGNTVIDLNTCFQSSPCQHNCIVNGISKRLSAPDIVSLFEKNGMAVHPHFVPSPHRFFHGRMGRWRPADRRAIENLNKEQDRDGDYLVLVDHVGGDE